MSEAAPRSGAMAARMAKELRMFETDPPHGVAAWPLADELNVLEARK